MAPQKMTTELPAAPNSFVMRFKDGTTTVMNTASRAICAHYCNKAGKTLEWGRLAYSDGETCWILV